MTADLRFARLTARGEAGLSVFRLRGRAVAGVLARIFRARGAARLGPGQVRVGSLLDGDATLDDVVVRIRASPDGWEGFQAFRDKAIGSSGGRKPKGKVKKPKGKR